MVSVGEIAESVRSSSAVRCAGGQLWTSKRAGETMDLSGLSGIIDCSPADQVVSVWAGTKLSELQTELAKSGQCLPHDALHGTVGGALSMNLPHGLEAQHGSWRDWVLGMTIVLADGTVAKSGSHAVKSVAGYDVHKLMIGARGTLGVVVEVILRTLPVTALAASSRVKVAEGAVSSIQRTLVADFGEALAARSQVIAHDAKTGTIWSADPAASIRRFASDWVLDMTGVAQPIEDGTERRLMRRAKQILDPEGKMNAGEFDLGAP